MLIIKGGYLMKVNEIKKLARKCRSESIISVEDRILAFKMFRVIKEIEDVNECNGKGFSEEYISNLKNEKTELLNTYYSRFGNNVKYIGDR